MTEKTFGTILANIQKTVSTHGWVYCSNKRVNVCNSACSSEVTKGNRGEENVNLRHFQHMMVSQCWQVL